MATMRDRQRFDAIRRRYFAASERQSRLEDDFRRKYGSSSPPDAWLTKGEYERQRAIDRAIDKEYEAMFALLDRISPRSWRAKVAAWWVLERLSFEDAITEGPLSVIPQAGFGWEKAEIERFSA